MALPVFDIDLDQEPFGRFRQVAKAYAPVLQQLAAMQVALETPKKGRRKLRVEQRAARQAQGEARQLLRRPDLDTTLAELRGAAEAAEVPLEALCSLSLQYEVPFLEV